MDGSSSTPTRQSPETESPVYVATPRTGSDDSDRRDRDVHTIRGNKDEGGYKLRPLRVKGADYGDDIEGGQLLGEKSDDENERDEVLYAIEGPEDDVELRSPVLRSLRRRTEFLYTCQEEKAVVRKLDKYLVGGLAVLYMLSFLDRSNIGNAKIAGMEEDLELRGDRYEWLLTTFYITYILFQWMTLCWKVFPAHKYVAFVVTGWGFVASLQALSVAWTSMLVLRAALGIFEAGFGSGVPFYLSLFYRREELALRTGLFISAAPLATAYAGFLAYAITSIPSPIVPWRLLFLLEGFPSLITGICAYYFIPDSPSDASFLNRVQKRIARQRLLVVRDDDEEDAGKAIHYKGQGFRWGEVWKAFADAGNWITAFIFSLSNVSFASMPVFLPTIIDDMDLGVDSSSAHAQALSVPPYVFALIITLFSTWLSDRYRSRSIPLFILCSISAFGYFLLAISGLLHKSLTRLSSEIADIESPGSWWEEKHSDSTFLASHKSTVAISYLGIMLAAGTIFAIVSLAITWNGNNSETETRRGTGIAIQQALGQCGPLLGTRLYPQSQAPDYILGSLTCAGCMIVVGLLVVFQRWRLVRENQRREVLDKRDAAMEGDATKRRKRFKYIL